MNEERIKQRAGLTVRGSHTLRWLVGCEQVRAAGGTRFINLMIVTFKVITCNYEKILLFIPL